MLDWQLFVMVAAPILTLFVGVLINRWFESRPVLLTYWGHVSSFTYQQGNGNTGVVNTHSVVIRNVGRQAATNVRLSHTILPDFNIWPPIKYHLEEVPNSGQDIVIPTVVPKEELTISYLYFPPTTFANVTAGVRCDEGFATGIPVLLQRQYPSWVNLIVRVLIIVGILALAYGLFELGSWIIEAISN